MARTISDTQPTFGQLVHEDFNDESCVASDPARHSSHPWHRYVFRHIEAFSRALQLDDQYFEHPPDSSSPTTPSSPVAGPSRIRKVAASSDFAPINLKVSRSVLVLPAQVAELLLISGATRRTKRYKHKKHDWWFLLLRWPLLVSTLL
jgi:hypothetical protein